MTYQVSTTNRVSSLSLSGSVFVDTPEEAVKQVKKWVQRMVAGDLVSVECDEDVA